ncbi:glycosyltransferase family 25 protein [Halovulum sp. GXIMD14793]
MKSQDIPVFVINLDRRTDRLAAVSDMLDEMGVSWTRVSAVDASQMSDEDLAEQIPAADPIVFVSNAAKGCFLSHISIWKRLVDSDQLAAVVVEDDVWLDPALAAIVARADWIPDWLGVLQMERFSTRKSKKLFSRRSWGVPECPNRVHRLYSRSGGTGTYLITRAAAQRALDIAEDSNFPVDHFLFNASISDFAWRTGLGMMQPAIAEQRRTEFISDIPMKELRKQRTLRYRLRRGWSEIRLLPYQLFMALCGKARLTELRDTNYMPRAKTAHQSDV